MCWSDYGARGETDCMCMIEIYMNHIIESYSQTFIGSKLKIPRTKKLFLNPQKDISIEKKR